MLLECCPIWVHWNQHLCRTATLWFLCLSICLSMLTICLQTYLSVCLDTLTICLLSVFIGTSWHVYPAYLLRLSVYLSMFTFCFLSLFIGRIEQLFQLIYFLQSHLMMDISWITTIFERLLTGKTNGTVDLL